MKERGEEEWEIKLLCAAAGQLIYTNGRLMVSVVNWRGGEEFDRRGE